MSSRSFLQWLLAMRFHSVSQTMSRTLSLMNPSGLPYGSLAPTPVGLDEEGLSKTSGSCMESPSLPVAGLTEGLWFAAVWFLLGGSQVWVATTSGFPSSVLSTLLAFMWHDDKLCLACSFSV